MVLLIRIKNFLTKIKLKKNFIILEKNLIKNIG